jgi:hypothetical protein
MFEMLPRYEDQEMTSEILRSYFFFVPTFLIRYKSPGQYGYRLMALDTPF